MAYILASASPRRKQLLEWAEIPFTISVHPTDESFPAGLKPEEAAVHIALEKARAVAPLHPGSVTIAADTIVVLDGDIIGKPADEADAVRTLERLSGRTHEVITGVALTNGEREESFFDRTLVSFHDLSPEGIRFYVANYRPFDKAGAYAIQEWIGVTGIKRIEGDFYNVMGLPVSRVVKALAGFSA